METIGYNIYSRWWVSGGGYECNCVVLLRIVRGNCSMCGV